MASRPSEPPVAPQRGLQTSELADLISTLYSTLKDGDFKDASALAMSCRPFLPYALAAIVGDLKKDVPVDPKMVNFIADMATLFPAVRPVLKDAVPPSAFAELLRVADGPTKDSLAQSLLMLELAGCMSSASMQMGDLVCDRPAVRWVAAVSVAATNSMSARDSDMILTTTLSHEELCRSEEFWDRRQLDIQVRSRDGTCDVITCGSASV